MPIKSYIIHSVENHKETVINALIKLENCEVIPAENKEVIVVVTDTSTEEKDKELYNKLLEIEGVKHMSLVSGFDTK